MREGLRAEQGGTLGEEFELLDELSTEEIEALMQEQDERDADGRLPAFGFVVRAVLGGLV